MPSANEGALLVALLAFLGVLLAPIITGFINRQADRENRRNEHFSDILKSLQTLRGEIQSVQYTEVDLFRGKQIFDDLKTEPDFQKLQAVYAQTYAIMISTGIKEIQQRANDIMDMENLDPAKKNEAIDFALKRLGQEYSFLGQAQE